MGAILNKTMDRDDLLTEEAKPIVREINDLIDKMYSKGMTMTSWYGNLIGVSEAGEFPLIKRVAMKMTRKLLARSRSIKPIDVSPLEIINKGPQYEPLPDAVDDGRFPWYLCIGRSSE